MNDLFTSKRERRLWIATVAVVIAIYSTLGLAGRITSELIRQDILGNIFFAFFVIVVAAILASGLIRRPGWREIWVIVGIVAVYGTVLLRMEVAPAERTHLFEYGLVAVLIHQALLERRQNGAQVFSPAVLAVVITALLGWVDEGIQWALPNRVYDIVDVGFNALAGLMAVVSSVALSWARQRVVRWF